MIIILKLIQIVLFTLFIIPNSYVIIAELFVRHKKCKKKRLYRSGMTFLISMLIFIIVSIIISYNDELYISMKYAPFMQSWIIIKSVMQVALQLLKFIIGCIGIFGLFMLLCEKIMSKSQYKLIEYEMPSRLTLRQKIEYPFMWYEMYVNVKMSNENYYILTDLAINELMDFIVREIQNDEQAIIK